MQGLGLCFKKGEYKYIGYFSNDKKQGYGIEITKNDVYRGSFKNGIRCGIGHLKKNNNLFIGQNNIIYYKASLKIINQRIMEFQFKFE